MKGLSGNKTVLGPLGILLGLSLIVGCFGGPYKPAKKFPAPVPDNAVYTINFNANGEFFIADQEGNTVLAEPIAFAQLLKGSDFTKEDWISIIGTFTLYGNKEGNSVWLCKEDECIQGRSSSEENSAVFSINTKEVNKDKLMPFFGDVKGVEKRGMALSSLIKAEDIAKSRGIKVINTFTLYKIKGSQKIIKCANNKCYCGCYNAATDSVTGCVNGQCP